jgi:hypothetical protein
MHVKRHFQNEGGAKRGFPGRNYKPEYTNKLQNRIEVALLREISRSPSLLSLK